MRREGRTKGQKDATKLIVVLYNFAKAHSVFPRFLQFSEQMMMMFTYSINQPDFIISMEYAYELNFSIYF